MDISFGSVIISAAALGLGVFIGYLLSRARLAKLEAEERAHGHRIQELEELRKELTAELAGTGNAERRASEDLKESRALLAASEKTIADLTFRLEKAEKHLHERNTEFSDLKEKHDRLETSQEEKTRHFREQLKLLEENKEELKKEFNRLAGEVFESTGRKFKELNRESIITLLDPIEKEMKGFRSKVETIHEKDLEQRTELRTELKNLQELNREITDQAEKLTTALRGQKKKQGNWGEMVLENILDKSGLRKGEDYEREVVFTSETGDRQRPDVIVHLPQGKHLIIDAKTSLNAYTDYVNAEDDTEAATALASHSKAVLERIDELSAREYSVLEEVNSPDVVILFIPVEAAYIEAVKHDPTIFQHALDENILVTTPTTLLTSLNIVRQLWRFEEQTKHTRELAKRAEKFHRKLRTFLESMEDIGNQLARTRDVYDRAMGQFVRGRGNLVKQASEFRELGVAVSKELPSAIVEKAKLELESGLESDAGVEDDE